MLVHFSRYVTFIALCLTTDTIAAQEFSQYPIQEDTTASCHNACTSLLSTLPQKVHYQNIPPTLSNAYFSTQQREVVPACVVLPSTTEDVSHALRIITQHECLFAVKSGGHAMFTGASNAPGGITVDLRYLNSISIEEDREITKIGTGNRWVDVYDFLDPMNLTVVGGRDADVGVGGFLLGGGVWMISRRYGWGADNVKNYELVLANGSITNINQISSPDLYWALRGGGKNFGIVTRFDMYTYVDTEMWGGMDVMLLNDIPSRLSSLGIPRQFSWSSRTLIDKTTSLINSLACKLGYCVGVHDVADMLAGIAIGAETDIFAHAYGVVCFFGFAQTYILVGQMNHGKGVGHAPSFGAMHSAKKAYKSDRIAKTSSFAREIMSYNTARQRTLYETATFRWDTQLQKDIIDIYMEENEVVRHIPGVLATIPMQIISKAEIKLMHENGGNCLGISPDDGPLLLLETAMAWKYEEDDGSMHQASKNIIDRAVALGKERGLHHPYIYQNYASKRQEVFESYGAENLARLRKIAEEYDPDHVFTRLSPGYFNI